MKNPLINEATVFSFGDVPTPYTASGFWGWAFSNMSVPMLRGVLVEYILVQHLIEHIDEIVGETVRTLTDWRPREGDLAQSIRNHYQSQPHGDVFDLQLCWGTTCEFKTTRAPKTWSLSKTTYWNFLKDANCWTYGFPAQIYVVAVLENEAQFEGEVLDLGALKFYIRTGRELDERVGERSSARFTDFSQDSPLVCTFDGLIQTLSEVQRKRLDEVLSGLKPGWRLNHSHYRNTYPLAVESAGQVQAGFYDRATKQLVKTIDDPWLKHKEPTWRDWEQAGFQYVHPLSTKQQK